MTEQNLFSSDMYEPERVSAGSECIIDQIDTEMTDYRDYYEVLTARFPDINVPIKRMQVKNRRMYEKVLLKHEPPKPADVSVEEGDSDFDDEDTLLMKGVREWYQTLGSLNSLKGAEDDLLRGAMVILAANGGEDYDHQREQQPSMLEAFMASPNANDLEKQESNEFLVLAGQMINEAALVTDDKEASDSLLATAANVFSRVYKDPDTGWEYKYKRDAARYLHAAELRKVAENINKFELEGNTEEALKWRNAFEAVQRISIADLRAILTDEKTNLSNGELGEQFYDILARDVVITEGRQHDILVTPAFLRQDKPHDKLSRDYGGLMAFDLRIGNHLIQVKAHHNLREGGYIPEIEIAGMKHGSSSEVRKDILKTLQAVLNVYNGVASDSDFELFVDREGGLAKLIQE